MKPDTLRKRAYRATLSEEKKAMIRARDRKRKAKHKGNRPFMAIDGEGGKRDAAGRQDYLLLRAGNQILFKNNRRLTTKECLDFILSLPQEPILISYYVDYDITMILRDLADDPAMMDWIEDHFRWQELLPPDQVMDDEAEEQEEPARSKYFFWRDYAILYRPHKSFKVGQIQYQTVQDPDNPKRQYQKRIIAPNSIRTIYDVGRFFQCPFVKALENWQITDPETLNRIRTSKENRSNFIEMSPVEIEYNRLECELLERLMERFREACYQADIRPREWSGAGEIASYLHKRNTTPPRRYLLSIRKYPFPNTGRSLIAYANEAYYGGRFEIMRVGHIKQTVYEYDISSAYPAAMLELPCPLCTQWHYSPRIPKDIIENPTSLYVADIAYRHPKGSPLGSFPCRLNGSLHWPLQGKGVYWAPEIRAAIRAGATVHHGAGWIAVKKCDHKPFAWVETMYQYRKELEKSLGKQAGIPIKLGINALYGKLAQRIGMAPYRDMIAAGLITAITRAKLIDTYRHNPNACIMLATDAVYMTEPVPNIYLEPGLGNFELTTYPDYFICQPGIHWCPSTTKRKSRGIPTRYIIVNDQKLMLAWNDFSTKYLFTMSACAKQAPSVPLDIETFIGLRQAFQQGRPMDAGCWKTPAAMHPNGRCEPRTISFDWSQKRHPTGYLLSDGSVQLMPYPGSPNLVSERYDRKAFTLSVFDELRDEVENMPDFIMVKPE